MRGRARRPGQLAGAADVLSSCTATTSIRAGEPSADAPQLSGRGGRDAVWATRTLQWRSVARATVAAPPGAGPSEPSRARAPSACDGPRPVRGAAVRSYDRQLLRRVFAHRCAHGQLGRLAGTFPGGAAAAPLDHDAALLDAVQDFLDGMGLGAAVGIAVRQNEQRRGEPVTTQMGDLPGALDARGGQFRGERAAEERAAAVPLAVGADEREGIAG